MFYRRLALMAVILTAPAFSAIAETAAPDNSQPAAAADPAKAAADRADYMKQIGARMKIINMFAQGKSGTAADAATAGQEINALAQTAASHFAPNSVVGDSEAKPEIWTNWADFEQKVAAFQGATANLASVTANGDATAIMTAFKATGATCKSCHESYRK